MVHGLGTRSVEEGDRCKTKWTTLDEVELELINILKFKTGCRFSERLRGSFMTVRKKNNNQGEEMLA